MKNLKHIIKESINKVLSESMSMMVSDHGYEDDLDNILDISHYIIKKVAYDLWPKLGLTPEQEQEIGGITSDFTPDGNQAFDETGTINFYIGSWPIPAVEKTLGYIRYILGEKDIELGDIKWEKVKDKIDPKDFGEWGITDGGESFRVVRIPVIKNGAAGQSGNPPEVNFSNTNANMIFGKVLGFENQGESYSMNTADLLMAVDKAKKELSSRMDIPDQDQHVQQGNINSTINGKEFYFRKLDSIQDFAKWASKHGYNKIHVS